MDRSTEADIPRIVGRHAVYAAIICLGISLWAVNSMVSVTILPNTVEDIGGLNLLSWATTAYVTASIVFSAAGGWAKASFGGRGGLMIGASVFIAGAVICAMAPDMPVLLLGRFTQGIGGGLVAALSYALVRSSLPEVLWPRMFALIAAVWGCAAIVGPALGGVLTQVVDWRAAFLFMAFPAVVLVLSALLILPPDRSYCATEAFPAFRLAALAVGITSIAIVGNFTGMGSALAALVGVGLLVATARIDQGAARPVLPRNGLSLRSPVGLGLSLKIVLIIATMPVSVYGPLILQRSHGLTPLAAGYTIALEVLAWTIAALVVARLPSRFIQRLIILGPLLVAAGLGATALTVAAAPAYLVAISVAVMGSGFGACWAFVSGRIMTAAPIGEMDRAAAAIPLVESTGVALGAALAGIAGSALGLDRAGTPAVLAGIGSELFALFTLFTLAGLACAIGLVRNGGGKRAALSS